MDIKTNCSVLVLSKDNYSTWLTQAKDVLEAHGLDDLIDREYDLNATLTTDEKTSEAKGRFYLRSTLSNEDKQLVAHCRTVKEIMELLETSYKGKQNIHALHSELGGLHWNMSTAELFVTRLNDLRTRMNAIQKQKDDLFIHKILQEMPTFMSMIKTHYMLKLNGGEKIVYGTLTDSIIASYHDLLNDKQAKRERKSNDNNQTNQQAFFTQPQRCTICQSIGHPTKYCQHNANRIQTYQSRLQSVSGRIDNEQRFNNRDQFNADQSNTDNRPRDHRSYQHQYNNQPFRRSNESVQNSNYNQQQERPSDQNRNNQNWRNQQNNNVNHHNETEVIPPNNQGQTGVRELVPDFQDKLWMMGGNRYGRSLICFDNAATRHIVNDLKHFDTYQQFDKPRVVEGCGSGLAYGQGSVPVKAHVRDKTFLYKMKDAYYMPNVSINIYSQLYALSNGMRFDYDDSSDYAYYHGRVDGIRVFTARRLIKSNDHFIMNMEFNHQFNKEKCYITDEQAHNALGHLPYRRIDLTEPHVDGLEVQKTHQRHCSCETCIEAKSKNKTFDHKLMKEDVEPGDVLHTDIGVMSNLSWRKNLYVQLFVDQKSRYTRGYYTAKQTEQDVIKNLDKCIANQNTDIGRKPKRLHSDKGRQLVSGKVVDYLYSNHITPTTSTAYHHQSNGAVEKKLQDVGQMARSMMLAVDAPYSMWDEAYDNAIYVMNRVYSNTVDKTPYEAYIGQKPYVGHIQPFGTLVMVHLPEQLRGNVKLSARAVKMRIVGHTESSTIYRVANMNWTQVTEQTNVTVLKEHETIPKRIDLSQEKDKEKEAMPNETKRNPIHSQVVDLDDLMSPINIPSFNKDTKTSMIKPNIYEFQIDTDQVMMPKSIKQLMDHPYREFI